MRKPCSAEGCDLTKDPKSSRYCYWHRLALAPMSQQIEEAHKRAAPEFTQDLGVGSESLLCPDCFSYVPTWYATGKRCKADAYAARHGKATERRYGLGRDAYDSLLALQGGKCAICRAAPRRRMLVVDHSHATGAVRGLICGRCNHDLLGSAHDALALLKAAVAYLERPPAGGLWTAPEEVNHEVS
jgi:hypothetical protein